MDNFLRIFKWKYFKQEVSESFVKVKIDIVYSLLENTKVIKLRLRIR